MALFSCLSVSTGVLLFFLLLFSSVSSIIYCGGYHYDDDCSSPLVKWNVSYAITSLFISAVIAASLHPKVTRDLPKISALCNIIILFWGFFTIVWVSVGLVQTERAIDGEAYDRAHPNCNTQLFQFTLAMIITWGVVAPFCVIYSVLACCLPRVYKSKQEQNQNQTTPTINYEDYSPQNDILEPSELTTPSSQQNNHNMYEPRFKAH